MGFSRFRTPEYLYQTPSGLFIFRIKVPCDCRPTIRQRELQYSLRTHCIYSARKYLASILAFTQEAFEGIRQGFFDGQSQAKITEHIKGGIRQARCDSSAPYRQPIQQTTTPSTSNQFTLATPKPEGPDAQEERTVNESPQTTQAFPTLSHKGVVSTDIVFSDLQKAFLKEKEVSKGWRLKTEEDHRAVFSLFIEIFGDIPVKNIDKSIMRDFKGTIIQLPPNMRKVSKYRDKSIPAILEMKPENTLSAHTVNKYLSRLSGLFAYAVTHGYILANPAGGFKVKLQSRPDEEREAYTNDDLKKLFSTPDVSRPSHYWAPLIALYSGCRLEEICQLHLEDIRKEQGVWIFDINNKNGKVLKNLSSVRLVPIHPQLIELGLIKYAEGLKTKGATRLFPELPKRRDGYGQTVSKWYQSYKKRCCIADGKTFHSFRHTFITHLKHKQVDPFMIHELDGHTINSETMGRYGKRYTPEILLKEAIEKIDYDICLIHFNLDYLKLYM